MNYSIETEVVTTVADTPLRRSRPCWQVRVTVKVASDICGIYERQYPKAEFSKGEAVVDMLEFLSGEIALHII